MQILFDAQAGNSHLARNLNKKVNMQCTKMKTHTEACHPCKTSKPDNFLPIVVTSIHKKIPSNCRDFNEISIYARSCL